MSLGDAIHQFVASEVAPLRERIERLGERVQILEGFVRMQQDRIDAMNQGRRQEQQGAHEGQAREPDRPEPPRPAEARAAPRRGRSRGLSFGALA
jgi:hypothetical protein